MKTFDLAVFFFVVILASCESQTSGDTVLEMTMKDKRIFLNGIDDDIRAKIERISGTEYPSPEQYITILSEKERCWETLRAFYSMSLASSGDIFGYLQMVYDQPEAFEMVEAKKTLNAAKKLRPFYEAMQSFDTQDEKDQYWHKTKEERRPIEISKTLLRA